MQVNNREMRECLEKMTTHALKGRIVEQCVVRNKSNYPAARKLNLIFGKSKKLDVIVLKPLCLARLLKIRLAPLIIVDFIYDERNIVVLAMSGIGRVADNDRKPRMLLDLIYRSRFLSEGW